MNTEKNIINLPQGCNEIIIREGDAPDMLEPKEPLTLNIDGTINAVYEYLTKRINTEQFLQSDCHIIVNRDNVSITLITNETVQRMRNVISAHLQYDPTYKRFGINSDKIWEPMELAMFLKMNRAAFADRTKNMELVSTLMNFKADVASKVEKMQEMGGSQTDSYSKVVNSNLPPSFHVQMRIFKGLPVEDIEVETFASVNGREVKFALLSPGAAETLDMIRDKVIDEQLSLIRELAPGIAIFEE